MLNSMPVIFKMKDNDIFKSYKWLRSVFIWKKHKNRFRDKKGLFVYKKNDKINWKVLFIEKYLDDLPEDENYHKIRKFFLK